MIILLFACMSPDAGIDYVGVELRVPALEPASHFAIEISYNIKSIKKFMPCLSYHSHQHHKSRELMVLSSAGLT